MRTLVISRPAEQARVGVVRNEEGEFEGRGGHRQPWPFSWKEAGLLQDFQPRWDVLHLLVERTPLAAPLMMNYGEDVFVCCGCHNEIPHTAWLKATGVYFLIAQEARNPKSRCRQGRLPGARRQSRPESLPSPLGWLPLTLGAPRLAAASRGPCICARVAVPTHVSVCPHRPCTRTRTLG